MRFWAVVILTLIYCSTAHAHSRSESFSSWRIDGKSVHGTLVLSAREVSQLKNDIESSLVSRIGLREDAVGCSLEQVLNLPAQAGKVRIELNYVCPATRALHLNLAVLRTIAPQHIHFARVADARGESAEFVFDRNHTERLITPTAQKSPEVYWAESIRLGIEHLIGGLDHLAFLAALLLLARGRRELLGAVSGFTLGHSVSLCATALGWVTVEIAAAEALIGLTIVLVAMEFIGRRTARLPAMAASSAMGLLVVAALTVWGAIALSAGLLLAMALFSYCYLMLAHQLDRHNTGEFWIRAGATALFGLIHGFGFAGSLSALNLPRERLLEWVLGFNLGLEIGQLALILAVLGIVVGFRKVLPTTRHPLIPEALASVLCALGVFWFVGRAVELSHMQV